MKCLNILFIFVLLLADYSFSASTAKRETTPLVPCPYHACTAEMLGCEQLAVNENGCTLCECVGVQPIPCPLHSCTAEMLGCSGELAKNDNGCDLCECEEELVPCPFHSCTAEMLGCSGELAKNENGCDLCECEEQPVPCPMHSCTAKMLGCAGELAENENGCELCECAEELVPCPFHSCTAEMLGCSGELAKNENGCELCECEAEVITPPPVPADLSATTTEQNRALCLLVPATGPCKGRHIRYFFNRATEKCEPFTYGGCSGNANNFETEEECTSTCLPPTACFLHGCTPEILNCPAGTGLAVNENGCELCECEVQPIPCPLHSCTAEMLGCSGELAKNENGCELCECEVQPIPCPLHSCTAEMLGCSGKLAKNENGCDLCECEAEVITPSPASASSSPTTTERNRGICLLIPDSGLCKGRHLRYYFNRASDKCEPFIYGGCSGNENNFETHEECSSACESLSTSSESPTPCFAHGCTPEILECPEGTGLAINENGCELCECAVQPGPIPCPMHSCTATMLGCTGGLATNENGCELCKCEEELVPCPFHSCTAEMLGCAGGLATDENGCELCECEAEVITPSPASASVSPTTTERNRAICLLAPTSGPCKGRHLRYYFNRASDECEPFIYGGCSGNENNFETHEECSSACEFFSTSSESPTPCFAHGCTPEILECPEGTGLAINENGCELCKCAVEPGLIPCPLHSCTAEMLGCSGELAKHENGCELCECEVQPIPCPLHSCTAEMLGCSGELAKNENGCDLCECEAEVITPPPVPADLSATTTEQTRPVCLLPPASGPCKGRHLRYYFNRAADKCEPFVYGGCSGNENNFETEEECSSACVPPIPCFLHGCTPEILNCTPGTGLATNENGCELCECEEPIQPIPCPLHSCTAEMLGCSGELAKNDNGCDLCECEEELVPCPFHSCTAEMLGCSGELAKNENGCELCECEELPVPCPMHSCTAEMLGCSGGLVKNDNGCELCECEAIVILPSQASSTENKGNCMLIPALGPCKGRHLRYYFNRAADKCEPFVYGGCSGNANNFETAEECRTACENSQVVISPVPCPYYSCTAEMLGCPGNLAKNENGCELCECEDVELE